jgi:glycosyltransferase involved in cell wall biosynthesis
MEVVPHRGLSEAEIRGPAGTDSPPQPQATRSPQTDYPPVSIIICAYNEAANLRENLRFFLTQDYPVFEVVVVNDGSTDDSLAILLEFQKEFPILHVLSVQGTLPGKKAALSLGIRRAKFEWLFLSDADCRPRSNKWLQVMMQKRLAVPTIILGYSPYRERSGWLNRFIRFEAFYTALQYFSFALAGHPYMGVGRNLAYHRTLFRQAEGFSQHAHLISGDDDLFVNQVATAANTTVCFSPEAWVYSAPKTSWRGYYIQKRRHHSVSRHYRWNHQMLLGALALSHVLHYVLLLILWMVAPAYWPVLLLIYSVRMSVVLLVSGGAGKRLGQGDLLPYLPLLDLLYLLYYFLFAPALLTDSRIRKWK